MAKPCTHSFPYSYVSGFEEVGLGAKPNSTQDLFLSLHLGNTPSGTWGELYEKQEMDPKSAVCKASSLLVLPFPIPYFF